MKAILIVLDSVGLTAAPDASDYGDEGAATLIHTASAVGGLRLPTLQRMGLGNIPSLVSPGLRIEGVDPVEAPLSSFGAMQEISQGKDTITGHWEIAGLLLQPGFALFPPGPPSFPADLIEHFTADTGRGILGNKAASGTAIVDELGAEHIRTGSLIVYTSADSVMQIAAHEDIVPLPELYRACEIGRRLCDPLRVGRVIARPFVGAPGAFQRTENRRDFAYLPSETTVLERVQQAGIGVRAVGKIEDIFAHRGITESLHTGNNRDAQATVEAFVRKPGDAFVFANFIDFDMNFGHRRDPAGYAECLRQTDAWLGRFLPSLAPDDLLIITADHGNDPTFRGSDHTRELVPVLAHGARLTPRSLGLRRGFYDIAQTVCAFFGLPPMPRGTAFFGRQSP